MLSFIFLVIVLKMVFESLIDEVDRKGLRSLSCWKMILLIFVAAPLRILIAVLKWLFWWFPLFIWSLLFG